MGYYGPPPIESYNPLYRLNQQPVMCYQILLFERSRIGHRSRYMGRAACNANVIVKYPDVGVVS